MADITEKPSNKVAIFLCFVWPGLGQLYMKQYLRGALFLGGSLVFLTLALTVASLSNVGWGGIAILAMWSMYSAYRVPERGEDL